MNFFFVVVSCELLLWCSYSVGSSGKMKDVCFLFTGKHYQQQNQANSRFGKMTGASMVHTYTSTVAHDEMTFTHTAAMPLST